MDVYNDYAQSVEVHRLGRVQCWLGLQDALLTAIVRHSAFGEALSKQSLTAVKGWSCSLGTGRGANHCSQSQFSKLRNVAQAHGCGQALWNELSDRK
jgi:hypothetical protein